MLFFIEMSNTLTPFLYNTKTLSRFARAGTITLRASLHTNSSRRAGGRRGYEDNDIPFELPPDLNPSASDTKYRDGAERDSLSPMERIIFGNIFEELERTNKKPLVVARPAPQPSTTKAEVETVPSQPQFLAGLLNAPVSSESKPMDPIKSAATVNAIIEHASNERSNSYPRIRGFDPSSPLQATHSASEREKALLLFPPTLRQAARRAFGMVEVSDPAKPAVVTTEGGNTEPVAKPPKEPTAGAGRSKEPLAKTVEIEARRRQARLKILLAMQACTSDFEVWKTMEKQVFTLVKRLGISNIPENITVPSAEAKVRKGRMKKEKELAQAAKAAASAARKAVQAEMDNHSAEGDLDVEMYGFLYPQLLSDGLNILGTKFARPSPYMLHLLPRIKELGLVSYVMGVSTAFYNRLMLIIWERYGDATMVLSLLEEMRHAGLCFDDDSLAIVSRIEAAFNYAEAGQRGHFAQALMGAPEFEPLLVQRLAHWTNYIVANLRE